MIPMPVSILGTGHAMPCNAMLGGIRVCMNPDAETPPYKRCKNREVILAYNLMVPLRGQTKPQTPKYKENRACWPKCSRQNS